MYNQGQDADFALSITKTLARHDINKKAGGDQPPSFWLE